MVYSGAYAILLALHLIGVAVLIGPLGHLTATAGRLARSGDTAGLTSAIKQTRIFTAATLVVVVLGTLLVDRNPTNLPRKGTWLMIAYALWIVAVLINLLLVVPTLKKARTEAERSRTEATTGQPTAQFAARLGAFGGISTLCWVAIIVVMVYKPGASG